MGGGGGGRSVSSSRFTEDEKAVSHFTDNKMAISRFTKKKTTFLHKQIFLRLLTAAAVCHKETHQNGRTGKSLATFSETISELVLALLFDQRESCQG